MQLIGDGARTLRLPISKMAPRQNQLAVKSRLNKFERGVGVALSKCPPPPSQTPSQASTSRDTGRVGLTCAANNVATIYKLFRKIGLLQLVIP